MSDVAMVKVEMNDEPVLAIRTDDRHWDDGNQSYWEGDEGDWEITDIRPLVVVDPESAEDIDRLCDLIAEDVDWLALQAALREFAAPTPPKPAEPTGLGAVIEDAEGNQWIKVVPTDGVDSWRRTGVMCGSLGPGFTRYNDIAAVSVLSDGWDE